VEASVRVVDVEVEVIVIVSGVEIEVVSGVTVESVGEEVEGVLLMITSEGTPGCIVEFESKYFISFMARAIHENFMSSTAGFASMIENPVADLPTTT